MSLTTRARFVHTNPRKLRLLAPLIRGKTIEEATAILNLAPKRAGDVLTKAIKSAGAAARQQNHSGPLAIVKLTIDPGPAFKRRLIHARGRSARMEHRMSHITVTVDAKPPVPKPREEAP